MIFGRILGWVFLAVALFAVAFEVSLSIKAGAHISIALGELWHDFRPISLLTVKDWFQQDEYLIQSSVSVVAQRLNVRTNVRRRINKS